MCTVFQVAVKIADNGSRGAVTTDDVIYIGQRPNKYVSTVEWEADSCSKEVRVPEDVFMSIVKVMKTISGTEDTPPPALTPAQQTVLLFYSTLMQQTLSFTCAQASGE
jgi:hypothetical protein